MNAREPVVEVRDVCFAYNDEEVLHNVSFRVEPLDLVAMVGPNGGGKTTLVRIVLGILSPDRGEVRVFGAEPREVRRQVGYVPQHFHFDPAFPVCVDDVVRMGRVDRHHLGPFRRADRRAADRALERVDLASFGQRRFAELSGGERQRVLIAQALATEPELLLLDEPTASVDVATEKRLFKLLHELNRELTVVVVSHNINVVTRHVNRVLCINRTASLHSTEELSEAGLQEAFGADFSLLHHDASCHVLDPSRALQTPHSAERRNAAP